MRYGKCLVTVLLGCVVFAGCSNSKRDSGKRLVSQIDEARRLFDHATAILANPPYIDKSTGQRSPISRKLLDSDVDVPTTRPVDYPQAEKKLADAEKILTDALSANPDAPLGTKADALHLLGQIHLADGKYNAAVAERLRNKADALRLRAHNALALARSNTIQARFGAKLANLPKDKITALRDETAKQLTGLDTAIADIDRQTTTKQRDNVKLSKENETLLLRSRALRDRSEVIGGPEGLKLLKEAQVIEGRVNDKTNRIAANQQAIEVLRFNKASLRQKRQGAEVKLAAINKRLRETDEIAKSTMVDVRTAQKRASEHRQRADKLAAQVVECCKKIAGREKLAIAAFGKDKAGKHLAEAQKTLRTRIDAAKAAMRESDKPNEILQGSSDEGRLVIIITARSSASLALGDLRRRQIATAKANAELADAIETTSLAEDLKGYLADADKTRNLAEANYKEAENQLQGILKLRLKGDAGNTLWMCQAMLANAYLGHYRLTAQSEVLAQASEFVDKALDDKEASPCLKSVVELQRLIQSAKQ